MHTYSTEHVNYTMYQKLKSCSMYLTEIFLERYQNQDLFSVKNKKGSSLQSKSIVKLNTNS